MKNYLDESIVDKDLPKRIITQETKEKFPGRYYTDLEYKIRQKKILNKSLP